MKISILVPVFNGIEYTKECLKNLNHQINGVQIPHATFETILIDDGSVDGTKEWTALNFPEVIILSGNGSLWWSGSINKGMQFAFDSSNADAVVWWNNDILAGEGYFTTLISQLTSTDMNIVLGSKVYQAASKDIVWGMGGYFDTVTGKKGMHAFNVMDSEELNAAKDVHWLPGMGTIVTRNVYQSVGLLNNEDFPQYHGDSDYTFRAYLSGYRIKVIPDLKIYNNTENSGLPHGYSFKVFRKSFSSIKSKYNLRKNLIFYKKYSTSKRAYLFLLNEYYRYIGGFVKWNILKRLGVTKKQG